MFTGIIESQGTVIENQISTTQSGPDLSAQGRQLLIDLGGLNAECIEVGDSIAVNGACLTVTRLQHHDGNHRARFDVSSETLSKCLIAAWRPGERVNLECALTLQKPLGGHLVSGHVDGVGMLVDRKDGELSTWMQFTAPGSIGRFIAAKGSITVDGISLTTNQVFDKQDATIFEVTLVSHTLENTNLGPMPVNRKVHLEIDLIARYVQRMVESDHSRNQ